MPGLLTSKLMAGMLLVLVSFLSTSLSAISMLYFLVFLLDSRIAEKRLTTLNHKPEHSPALISSALLNNLVLICLFAIQHSLFARSSVKSAIEKALGWENSKAYSCFYALGSALVLLALFYFWTPLNNNTAVWTAPFDWASYVMQMVNLTCWWLTMLSVLSIHRFQLCGGEPLVDFLFGRVHTFQKLVQEDKKLITSGLYGIVRHPAMFFLILSIWTTPLMSLGKLLFSVAFTLYIIFAVRMFEEPQLMKEYKTSYTKYKQSVPYQLMPGLL